MILLNTEQFINTKLTNMAPQGCRYKVQSVGSFVTEGLSLHQIVKYKTNKPRCFATAPYQGAT
jgi:hypothetical protein